MGVARPRSLDEALDALAAQPDADLLAGGTDVMVDINFGRRRPDHVVALRRLPELQGWRHDGDVVDLGALLTYRQIEDELADLLPGFAAAARTVGSPQIRNAGTVGGNVGTASPAGDMLPLLSALDADIVCAGPDGERTVALRDYVTGPKQTDRRPGELIRRIRFRHVDGPQQFLKVGPRNAMVISVVCLALVLDPVARDVRVGLGSVTPRPQRSGEAEAFATDAIDWEAHAIAPDDAARFGRMVGASAAPVSDHRGTADYRSHAVGVLARRALDRALRDLATANPGGDGRG